MSKHKNMASKWKADMNNLVPVLAFFLGAALAMACIFFFASSDAKLRLLEIASWKNGTQLLPPGAVVSEDISVAKLAPSQEMTETQHLAELLKNASMDDNTVIMTSINKAYAAPGSLLDLFLESFHVGEGTESLLKHLLVVAMDPEAFETCKSVHPHCYFLKTEGVDYRDAKFFMSKDYLEMMWSRNRFQQRILELGYNFLFSDIDIMWFRDPLRHIAITSHIAIASDLFFGDPDSLRNLPYGGFVYVRSHNKTIEFYKNWQLARQRFPGQHEQYIFNKIKGEFSERFQVKIQFFDTVYCGGFCQLSKDLSKICTLHANCCVGLDNKIYDLKNVLEDWKTYKSLPAEEKRKGNFHWRLPGKCIH